jgi:hypothetical protein
MNKNNIAILIFGIILIFISLYIFTRPAIFSTWDFSSTGQIGDTIGGITGPVINLIGAFLVYISFQAQIKANKIQSDALAEEKTRLNTESIYQKQVSQFDDIKLRLKELEFIVQLPPDYALDGTPSTNAPLVFRGLNALNAYTIRISNPQTYIRESYETYGMFLSFQFMMLSIDDLIKNIDNKIKDTTDKEYLLSNIKLFYNSFLKSFANRIIAAKLPDNPNKTELTKINQSIKKKFNL